MTKLDAVKAFNMLIKKTKVKAIELIDISNHTFLYEHQVRRFLDGLE